MIQQRAPAERAAELSSEHGLGSLSTRGLLLNELGCGFVNRTHYQGTCPGLSPARPQVCQ